MKYEIINPAGTSFGAYEGKDEIEAVRHCLEDAGYNPSKSNSDHAALHVGEGEAFGTYTAVEPNGDEIEVSVSAPLL